MTDLSSYIGHDHGFVMTVQVPAEEQWRLEVLQKLVEDDKIPAELARAAVARGDWKAVQRLIRTATTTRELPR